jgi:IS30 family transposase
MMKICKHSRPPLFFDSDKKERADISERPTEVDLKARLGDLEGGTNVGKNHKGAFVTLNDRKTGFSWSMQLDTKESDGVADAIIKMLSPFAGYLHTLTFDNGREFVRHEKVSKALGIKIYFAKPYHSRERGANENPNGLYRQYIPKGTNRKKSTFRCSVEHVFGFEEGSMHRLTTRTIGLMRAKSDIFLTNLIYNFLPL